MGSTIPKTEIFLKPPLQLVLCEHAYCRERGWLTIYDLITKGRSSQSGPALSLLDQLLPIGSRAQFYRHWCKLTENLGRPKSFPIGREREREMFYLTTHSTHFIYGYMASDIWLRTILIVRKETRCRHIGYSYRLTARVLLYASSHRQDNTYHGLCYTSCGALAGTRNSSMGPPHEGSIRRPIAP